MAARFRFLYVLAISSVCLLATLRAVSRGVNPVHPLFVNVLEFNHNSKDNILEVSCKMYFDDFENALKASYKIPVDITHPKDVKALEKMMFEYIQKHLQLKINGKAVQLQYVGYEKENEALWTYIQVNNVTAVKKLEISNNLMYELYNTQISIMHAAVGGVRKSTKINNPDTQASFDW